MCHRSPYVLAWQFQDFSGMFHEMWQCIRRMKLNRGRLKQQKIQKAQRISDREDCLSAPRSVADPQISRPLSFCKEWQSLCSFMNQVVLKVHRSPCGGHLAFLPDFFEEKGNAPCLKHAILSVSYITLANISGTQESYIKARRHYGLSLGHLNKMLGSREDAMKDETFAACLLLSIFFVRRPKALVNNCLLILSRRTLSTKEMDSQTLICRGSHICCSCAGASKQQANTPGLFLSGPQYK